MASGRWPLAWKLGGRPETLRRCALEVGRFAGIAGKSE